MANGWLKTKHIENGAVTNDKLATGVSRGVVLVYDVTEDGGSSGTYTLTTLDGSAFTMPAGAISLSCRHIIIDAFVAVSGTPTVAIGYTGSTGGIKTAVAYNHASYTEDGITADSGGVRVWAESPVTVTVASNVLSAGRMLVQLEYIEQ